MLEYLPLLLRSFKGSGNSATSFISIGNPSGRPLFELGCVAIPSVSVDMQRKRCDRGMSPIIRFYICFIFLYIYAFIPFVSVFSSNIRMLAEFHSEESKPKQSYEKEANIQYINTFGWQEKPRIKRNRGSGQTWEQWRLRHWLHFTDIIGFAETPNEMCYQKTTNICDQWSALKDMA